MRGLLADMQIRSNIEGIKMSSFKLTIDGVVVEAQPGMTVLQAAKNAGLFIPSLCAHDELAPYGACRLCVVEIDGVRGTPTSCTTPAAEGMVVRTNTEQLQLQRKRTIELMMSGHPSPCLTCDSREDCESEKVTPTRAGNATRCGTCANRPGCELREVSLGNFDRDIGLPMIYDPAKVDHNDPFIDKDHNLCILCGRCFRVCEKIHGKPAISIANRGKKAKIASEFEKEWSSEECTFCGACVEECPTGSLTDRWGKWFGQEEKVAETICAMCPKHCRVNVKIKDGRIVGAKALSLKKEDALCALGRFGIPQIMNSRSRLTRAQVRREKELVPASGEEIIEKIAEILESSKGKILMVECEGGFYETRKAIRAIAKRFDVKLIKMPMNSNAFSADVIKEIEDGKYDAVFVEGNYISEELAEKIPHLVIADFMKTSVQDKAEVVIPVSIFGETAGTFGDVNGQKIFSEAVVESRLDQRPFSGILSEVCQKFGIDVKSEDFELESLPADFNDPAEDKKYLPTQMLGHFLADYIPDLQKFGMPISPKKEKVNASFGEGFEILESRTIVPNFHELTIKAPEMARFARPGQFAVLMANADSERSPFTIIDWNAEEGWVKFILEEVGRSSAEIGALKKGDKLAVASGPLGTPINLDKFESGTSALLLGGCYGIGAIYPIARELKARGVKVTCAIEASSAYLLYYKDKLASVSEELIIRTRDGSEGKKGGCKDILAEIGSNFDSIVAIGCVFMMKQCASVAPKDTKLALCSLNPIMVDGTGMCGACRVNVGGDTKFACVEGPFFPLLEVDFTELGKRRTAYKLLEIEAMPRHIGSKCYS